MSHYQYHLLPYSTRIPKPRMTNFGAFYGDFWQMMSLIGDFSETFQFRMKYHVIVLQATEILVYINMEANNFPNHV
jgi:hypothetical protein